MADESSQSESSDLARMRADIGNAAYEKASLGSFEVPGPSLPTSPASKRKADNRNDSTMFPTNLGKMFQNAKFDDSDSRAVQGLAMGPVDCLGIKPIMSRTRSQTSCVSAASILSKLASQKAPSKKTVAPISRPGATSPVTSKLTTPKDLTFSRVPKLRPALMSRDHNEGRVRTCHVKKTKVTSDSTAIANEASPPVFIRYTPEVILSLRHIPAHSIGPVVSWMPPLVNADLRPVRYSFNELLAARLIKHHIPRPSTPEILRQAMDAQYHLKHYLDAPIDSFPPLSNVQKRSSGIHHSGNFDPMSDFGSKLAQDHDITHYCEESRQIQDALVHTVISDSPKYNVKRHRILFSHVANLVVRDTEAPYLIVMECVERNNGIIYRNLFLRQINRIMYINAALIESNFDIGDLEVRVWFRGRSSHIPNNRVPQSIILRFSNLGWLTAFVKCAQFLRDPDSSLFKDASTITPYHQIMAIQTRDLYANPKEHRNPLKIIMDEFQCKKHQREQENSHNIDSSDQGIAVDSSQVTEWDVTENPSSKDQPQASIASGEIIEDLIDLGDYDGNFLTTSQKTTYGDIAGGSTRFGTLTKCEMDWIADFGASGIKDPETEEQKREMKMSSVIDSINLSG